MTPFLFAKNSPPNIEKGGESMKGYYVRYSYRGWMPCWGRWVEFSTEADYEEAYKEHHAS